jgi:hypothetical protein
MEAAQPTAQKCDAQYIRMLRILVYLFSKAFQFDPLSRGGLSKYYLVIVNIKRWSRYYLNRDPQNNEWNGIKRSADQRRVTISETTKNSSK